MNVNERDWALANLEKIRIDMQRKRFSTNSPMELEAGYSRAIVEGGLVFRLRYHGI